MAKIRLDAFLVLKARVPSRSKATDLIENEGISIFSSGQWNLIQDPKYKIEENWPDENYKILSEKTLKYVARSGLKLEAALNDFSISVTGRRCLDVGQSTGGFTDCLLFLGAASVAGVEVGTRQLHEKLLSDSRVLSFENLNIKNWKQEPRFCQAYQEQKFSLGVVDVSFVSVLGLLKDFVALAEEWLILVKPQFEIGSGYKLGDDTNAKKILALELEFQKQAQVLGFQSSKFVGSKHLGREGTQEYFVRLKTALRGG